MNDGANESIESWSKWLSTNLRDRQLPSKPKELRDELCRILSEAAESRNKRFLVLAFGSVARLERAEDLDLIIVEDGYQTPLHTYRRIAISTLRVDLNLVNTTWLEAACEDTEWGYWLTESYPLCITNKDLENSWCKNINRYWSSVSIRHRAQSHRDAVELLTNASSIASASERPLLARLLAHEAARALVSALIDKHGNRVFSHRSLQAEFDCIVTSLELKLILPESLPSWLAWDRAGDTHDFLELRRRISSLFRSTEFALLTSYHPSLPRMQRFQALAECADSTTGLKAEQQLESLNADSWLPKSSHKPITTVHIDQLLPMVAEVSRHNVDRLTTAQIPTAGEVDGARWVSSNNGRAKLIINTGGCRTPSCRFCILPMYGRAFPRGNITQTLETVLEKYSPLELALYNDGNFFNTREINSKTFDAICATLKRYHLHRLTVESLPRFVTRDCVEKLKAFGGIERLTIALGLQSVGNHFSIGNLGRPDVDALYDYAIDQIHAANAEVRLYILWNFGPFGLNTWERRLKKSVEWASMRRVEKISVCNYRTPMYRITSESAPEMDRLRTVVADLPDYGSMQVEIVNEGLMSCA